MTDGLFKGLLKDSNMFYQNLVRYFCFERIIVYGLLKEIFHLVPLSDTQENQMLWSLESCTLIGLDLALSQ